MVTQAPFEMEVSTGNGLGISIMIIHVVRQVELVVRAFVVFFAVVVTGRWVVSKIAQNY